MPRVLILALALLFLSAHAASAAVQRAIVGRTPEGVEVESFTLTNAHGSSATILTLGATLADLRMPDRTGKFAAMVNEIIPTPRGIAEGFPQSGAVMGRVANRIAQARFTLDGRTYALTPNSPPHHMHGGKRGFKFVVWRPEVPDAGRSSSVRLSYISVAGEEGYPGTLNVSITYTLTDDDTLRLEYSATTSAPTPLNLTNHAYFNLNPGADVVDYLVEIAAERYTAVDAEKLPTGALPAVRGTVFDFTRPTRLGSRAGDLGPRAIYDHNYVINRPESDTTLRFAARVSDAVSGRQIEVWTTEPGMQLYTSGLNALPVAGRKAYVCLETQHFPDSVNHPTFPSTIVRPGTPFRSTTEYRFSSR
jgi:aldose 1-epimerase